MYIVYAWSLSLFINSLRQLWLIWTQFQKIILWEKRLYILEKFFGGYILVLISLLRRYVYFIRDWIFVGLQSTVNKTKVRKYALEWYMVNCEPNLSALIITATDIVDRYNLRQIISSVHRTKRLELWCTMLMMSIPLTWTKVMISEVRLVPGYLIRLL